MQRGDVITYYLGNIEKLSISLFHMYNGVAKVTVIYSSLWSRLV